MVFLSLLQTILCSLFQRREHVLLWSTEATYSSVHGAGELSTLLSGEAGGKQRLEIRIASEILNFDRPVKEEITAWRRKSGCVLNFL